LNYSTRFINFRLPAVIEPRYTLAGGIKKVLTTFGFQTDFARCMPSRTSRRALEMGLAWFEPRDDQNATDAPYHTLPRIFPRTPAPNVHTRSRIRSEALAVRCK
jgi:hypothetical protein